jgi:hypothetical protein
VGPEGIVVESPDDLGLVSREALRAEVLEALEPSRKLVGRGSSQIRAHAA